MVPQLTFNRSPFDSADKWNSTHILQHPRTQTECGRTLWQNTGVLTDWGRQTGTSSLWGPTWARSRGVCGCEAPSHRDYLFLQDREDTVRVPQVTFGADLCSTPYRDTLKPQRHLDHRRKQSLVCATSPGVVSPLTCQHSLFSRNWLACGPYLPSCPFLYLVFLRQGLM